MSTVTYLGTLSKMPVSLKNGVANYSLAVGDKLISLNNKLGSSITISYQNAIYCANCGALTKKSYSQGYCYLCSQRLACCDLCIVRPETCHYHLNTCREPSWGKKNCFSPHIIYLANSSATKVGITKYSNTPNRWIDQGANCALPILVVNTRLESGLLEQSFKRFITDKTNWRKMLKNEVVDADLKHESSELLKKVTDINDAKILYEKVVNISYPVIEYPKNIVTLNLDKHQTISGVLMGIKGQYLILSTGVINIRKFSSYLVKILLK